MSGTGVVEKPAELQVFYDGECPLCRREMAVYQKKDRGHRIEWVDISKDSFDAAEFGLDAQRVQNVMHARDAGGRVYTEVGAFERIWEVLPANFLTMMLRVLLMLPGAHWVAGKVYRLFARNRYRLTGRCEDGACKV